MSDQQTSYFQKMRSPQKGRGWGVFDVLLMSTKTMCVFYHQWCIDQINLHEIQPHLSHGNGKSKTNPSPTKHLAKPCFFMFLFSLFCAEPCGATRWKARATSSRKATSSNSSQSSRLVGLWFVLGLVYWLFVVTLSSWCFLPDYLLLSFHEQTKLWFLVCGVIHLKYLCGSELMNNSAGLYLPALSWNFSYTFEHCITKAFYRKSSLNLLLAISPTFVKYLVRISFKGSPFRGLLR